VPAIVVAVVGCDNTPSTPTAASAPEVLDYAALPPAYRTPQAVMQAMATGQLFERLDRCEGFAVRNGPDGTASDRWMILAGMVRGRTGERRPSVISRTIEADPETGGLTILVSPLGAGAVPFQAHWTIRTAEDDTRIDCVERVTLANAS
jgi:hypothetical protein